MRITSQYLPIAQMSISSARNKLARPTSPGATRATTSQRVPSKYPVDPTFRWEICSIPPQLPIMFHTTAGPRFDVEKVCEPLDPVIPRMKDDMPIGKDQSMPGGGLTIARSNFRRRLYVKIVFTNRFTMFLCPVRILSFLQTVMYIGNCFTFPLCLKQAAQWGIQG